MATKKTTAEQVKVAMAKVEAAKAAEATKTEEKAPAKKTAAKKTTAAKTTKTAEKKTTAAKTTKAAEKKTTATKTTTTAEKKAPTKKDKLVENVVIQACGYEVTTADVTAKVVEIVGKKVKELNIYVKPEEGMVYYTADGEQGSVAL